MASLNFNPDAQWFEPTERKCTCGKRATGILRGTRNDNIGPRCERCANSEIAKARKHRSAWLAALATRKEGE